MPPSLHSIRARSARDIEALEKFVDDEMLRAPLLFDQMIESTVERMTRDMSGLPPLQRSSSNDLLHAIKTRRTSLADQFVRSLHDLAMAELRQQPAPAMGTATGTGTGRMPLAQARPNALALVDEDEVAVDVELAHAIQGIKNEAEYELRELQTYTAALVGDMDLTRDHNPFRAESYARALWAAAQALPLSRGFQVQFMRQASQSLAALLRQAYAASSSRLDAQGIEPAAYRTVILPSGARSSRTMDSSYSPDLRQVQQTLSTLALALRTEGAAAAATTYAPGHRPAPALAGSPARPSPDRQADPQTQALVDSLFEAIRQDKRVPGDVLMLILRLHSPALKLAQLDAAALTEESHPLWEFVNRLAYEAEMVPDPGDPERARLLRLAQATIDQLIADPRQTAALYVWAADRLQNYLRQGLARRCTAAASQIGALQKLEDKLLAGQPVPTTLNGALDVPQMVTVPADLMPASSPKPLLAAQSWLEELAPGDWVRVFLQGQWLHVQVLWPGERREIWLLGDGASDATWAVRKRALLILFEAGLLKSLKQRSLVRRAAGAVHAQAMAQAA
jgi:hypothetical protein